MRSPTGACSTSQAPAAVTRGEQQDWSWVAHTRDHFAGDELQGISVVRPLVGRLDLEDVVAHAEIGQRAQPRGESVGGAAEGSRGKGFWRQAAFGGELVSPGARSGDIGWNVRAAESA